jgi:hypothetical protein
MPDNFVDLYQPQKMVAALQQILPPKRFFHQTFFKNAVLHETPTVHFDLYKGTRKISAYVNPIHDGVVVEREGYETKDTKPAYVKEIRVLRPTDTQIRLMGETPYQPKTPRDRAAAILGQDLLELETRLVRLEEKMCAEALLTGKVVVKGKGWDAQVDFGYEAGKNKITLSGTDCWDTPTGDPMKDIDQWRKDIVQRCGIQPTHCIIGSKVGWAIIDNPKVKERLDIRKYEMGQINPAALPEGVSYFGELRLPSGVVSLYSYDECYADPNTGKDIPLMPEDMILLGSTNARCEFHYGLIQNLNSLQATTRFPSSWLKEDGSARFVQLESAPMPNIFQVDAFVTANVLQGG